MPKTELNLLNNLKMAATKTFDLSDKQLKIGDIFTPIKWAEFAITTFNIFQKWIDGATVFDPTMGEGNLLEALITTGLAKGYEIDALPTENLFGNELNTDYYFAALSKFRQKYGIDMAQNFTNEDILQLEPQSYDIVFGNPPWQNFVDLPDSYKEQIKSYFFKYDLIGNSQNLLLGGSRVDIAALVMQVSIKDFLSESGEAIFFTPLSLFLNDGANRNFRTYSIGNTKYCLKTIYDFNGEDVFGGVATRYGLCHFVRDKDTVFPISYFRKEEAVWASFFAKPVFDKTDPLSIMAIDNHQFDDIPIIYIKKESTPRQGVNTCGANDVYFFDTLTVINTDVVVVSNKTQQNVELPRKFIFPLITGKQFKLAADTPCKWVLLPYNLDGKPLEWQQIQQYPLLQAYLLQHKNILQNRKGVMLNAMLKRGHWWAMLGVGAYSFFKFKVVWEAYGKTTFNPQVFEGEWQANQSLQAFIPVKTQLDAEKVKIELSDKRIEEYLLSLKMEGTMNWAQPGKIKKLIQYKDETLMLFD
jgi:hypothetical protein